MSRTNCLIDQFAAHTQTDRQTQSDENISSALRFVQLSETITYRCSWVAVSCHSREVASREDVTRQRCLLGRNHLVKHELVAHVMSYVTLRRCYTVNSQLMTHLHYLDYCCWLLGNGSYRFAHRVKEG